MIRTATTIFTVAVVLCIFVSRAFAYDAEAARKVFGDQKNAVVTLEVVIKQQMAMPGMGSHEEEMKEEMSGTVVTPDGVTLVSLSEIDPTIMYKAMMGGMGGDMGDMTYESQVTSMKFIGEAGEEIEAEEVLRDQDLNIAVVRPKAKPEKDMAYVDINMNTNPGLFETVMCINRLGKAAKRVHGASFHPIESIVDKPRLFYIIGNDSTSTSFGTPGFTLDGKFVGFFTMRMMKGGGEGLHNYSPNGMPGMLPVLLPTEDLKEVIEQVPAREE